MCHCKSVLTRAPKDPKLAGSPVSGYVTYNVGVGCPTCGESKMFIGHVSADDDVLRRSLLPPLTDPPTMKKVEDPTSHVPSDPTPPEAPVIPVLPKIAKSKTGK